MTLLPVEDALSRIVGAIEAPTAAEETPIGACAGRTLAADLAASRTQPPFRASAMDGYAVRHGDVAQVPVCLTIVGRSVAGGRHPGEVGPGEAVRIFTGAPVPDGADTIVIQENAEARDDGLVLIREGAPKGRFVRPAGLDFSRGDTLLRAGQRLDARHLALAAAMGHARLPVRVRPRVAIVATGDELVRPGEAIGPDQIVASNLYAIAALVERAGGLALDLGIAADRPEAIVERFEAARAAGADMLVTLGGASVGEHDLVQRALGGVGLELGFWRIAMRPGKPLMHGRLGAMHFLGLPGNPVSSIVCAILFLVPALRALQGDPGAGDDRSEAAVLGAALPANDARQDYVRARLVPRLGALPAAIPLERQDSSMLNLLARADVLVVRPPHAPAAPEGDVCRILRFDLSA